MSRNPILLNLYAYLMMTPVRYAGKFIVKYHLLFNNIHLFCPQQNLSKYVWYSWFGKF